jgi:hypothetical protein
MDGVFLHKLMNQDQKSKSRSFGLPTAITVVKNNLYIADFDSSKIKLYTLEGLFLTSFGKRLCRPMEILSCESFLIVYDGIGIHLYT